MTSLYRRILGHAYDQLPQAVRQLHDPGDETLYRGRCRVRRGQGWWANRAADLLSLPKTGEDVDVTVAFRRVGDAEHWTRHFNGKRFFSRQWQQGPWLYERLNFTTLKFEVLANAECLQLRLHQVYVLGIPMIRALCPRVIARETERDERFHFHVEASVALLGLLVYYEGGLERTTPHASLRSAAPPQGGS